MSDCDFLVVGSGLSGLLFACSVVNLGFSVVLIEKDPSVSLSDTRAITIGLKNKEFLEQIGIWHGIKSSIIKDIRVADGDEFVHFDCNMLEVDALGFVVIAKELKRKMLTFLQNNSVNIITDCQFSELNLDADYANVKVIKKGSLVETIKCKLCVIATGSNCKITQAIFPDYIEYNYNQIAFCFDIGHEYFHCNTAVECFFAEGPLAILPSRNRFESHVVFTLNSDFNEDNLFEELCKKIDYLGEMKIISKVKKFPLALKYSKTYYKRKHLLIGNALHEVHPIAGQGWNLTIRDVECFYDLLKDAKYVGMDFSSNHFLYRFEKRRKFKNMAMIAITDITNNLFSSNSCYKSFLRKFAMRITERIPYIKKSQMLVAMGYII